MFALVEIPNNLACAGTRVHGGEEDHLRTTRRAVAGCSALARAADSQAISRCRERVSNPQAAFAAADFKMLAAI
jgi:hypothetical protein